MASEYVGNIGDRITINNAKCIMNLKNTKALGGTDYRTTFMDQEGNILIWTTKRSHNYIVGENYYIRATVQNHIPHKGIKRTSLFNCFIRPQKERN